jgi:hypothetical protein
MSALHGAAPEGESQMSISPVEPFSTGSFVVYSQSNGATWASCALPAQLPQAKCALHLHWPPSQYPDELLQPSWK